MAKQLIPVNIFDTSSLELWFSEMAAEGLILEEVKGNKAVFRDEYCQKIKYGVIPTGDKEERPSTEMQTLFEEEGWHFVCGIQKSLFVFSNEGDYPKALPFTKEEEYAALKELKKQKRNSVTLLVLGIFVLGAIQLFGIYNNIEDYILGDGQYVGLTYAVAFLLNVITMTREIRSYRILRRKLENIDSRYDEELLDLPTTKWFRFANLLHILSVFFLVLPLLALTLGKDGAGEIAVEELSIPYTALQELEMTKSGREYTGRLIFVERASTLLSPVQYTIEQEGSVEYDLEEKVIAKDVYLVVEYYELRFAFLGEQAVRGLMKYYNTYPVQCEGVDQAWIGQLAGNQRIFLRKGNRILSVAYGGDLAIKDYMDEFVTMLK